MNKFTTALLLSTAIIPAQAKTILLEENFDAAWTQNFTSLELDGAAPNAAINAYFMDSNGVSQPWWPLKDTQNSKDRFLSSHSFYTTPGQSRDWIVSRALEIPSEGFSLQFEAQSLPIRSGNAHALSDLWIYITETPVSKSWQPDEADATYHLESISAGADRDAVEGDFSSFSYPLDSYVGKTIYISFANLNNDKDILCLNNISVSRADAAEFTCSAPEYTLHGEYAIDCTISSPEQNIAAWTLTMKCGDSSQIISGDSLTAGETLSHTFTANVESDATSTCILTFEAEGISSISRTLSTTGLAFLPTRHVMLEETTGTWCGNCPTGIYTIEKIAEDEAYADRFHPISIHVGDDPMKVDNYEYMFGIGAVAPVMRVDRGQDAVMVGNLDFKYDPSNPNTAAAKIISHFDNLALADIHLQAAYDPSDDSRINVTTDIIPAVTLDGARYRVGYVLTENNVYNEDTKNARWRQANYLSGDRLVGEENPFFHLPSKVAKMRYHDVARELYDFHGEEGSIPARPISATDTLSLSRSLLIPVITDATAPAINRKNLYVTAFIIDSKTDAVINCARTPLSDEAEPKYSLQDLLNSLSVDEVISGDASLPIQYFTLDGKAIPTPSAPGIYLMRQGARTSKIVL